MIPSRNNFVITNMVCKNHYELIQTDSDNCLKIVSKSHDESEFPAFLFKYGVFRDISKNNDDDKEDKLEELEQDIITAISKLDCKFSSENNEAAKNSVLAFCNKYGLLKSTAYRSRKMSKSCFARSLMVPSTAPTISKVTGVEVSVFAVSTSP